MARAPPNDSQQRLPTRLRSDDGDDALEIVDKRRHRAASFRNAYVATRYDRASNGTDR
jgi:hypothetical protein